MHARTQIILLGLMSWNAFAGTLGDNCHTAVNVPCVNNGWEASGQFLYLKPSYSGISFYGPIINALPGGAATTIFLQNVSDSAGGGFQLQTAYHFFKGSDLLLNWYHWGRSTLGVINVPNGSTFFDPVNNLYNGSIDTKRQPEWDAVNFEVGQMVNVHEFANLRYYGGLQYMRVITETTFASANSTATAFAHEKLTFNGIGPRIGLDMFYGWPNIKAFGKGAVGVLYGNNKFRGFGIGNLASTWLLQGGSTKAIVPYVETKLGVTGNYNLAQGQVAVDAGWFLVNYFNVQQNMTGDGEVNQSDFSLQGPYVGIKWIGNAA